MPHAQSQARRAPRVRSRAHSGRITAPIGLAVVLLLGWELLVRTGGVSASFLPAPSSLAVRLVREFSSSVLPAATGITLGEAALGTLLAAVVALPLGYLIARVTAIDWALTPYVTASQAIPAVALAPLLALWLGYGLAPISILCALVAFFPMVVTTTIGVRALPGELVEAARLDGAAWWQRLVWIEAPLIAPSALAGVRAGAALSVTGAVVGEFTMGGQGLGMLLTVFRNAGDTEGLFATLVVLVVLAVGLFMLLRALGGALRTPPSRTRAI